MICLKAKAHQQRIEDLLCENASLRAKSAGLEAQVEHERHSHTLVAAEKDRQAERLEATVKDLRRELSMVTSDLLTSMGIRQLPSGETPSPVTTRLETAARHEDRMDDELVGLSPVDWQAEAQRLEWEAYTQDQHQELKDYIASRKAQKETKNART